jgi:hypothetical protein
LAVTAVTLKMTACRAVTEKEKKKRGKKKK